LDAGLTGQDQLKFSFYNGTAKKIADGATDESLGIVGDGSIGAGLSWKGKALGFLMILNAVLTLL